ncbi:MAG: type II secretion system protein [Elusimicrobiota bacterium]
MNKKCFYTQGFSLIELMLVLALLAIVMTIITPQLSDTIRRAKEASTKGNLGILRSSMRLYYVNNEMLHPETLNAIIPDYLDILPTMRIGAYNHKDKTDVQYDLIENNIIEFNDDSSGWVYGGNGGGGDDGLVIVACSHTDTKKASVSAW